MDERKRYRRFEVARRASTEPRVINAPIKPIKDLQRTLASQLSACYRPRVQVHGFVEGRSPSTNASLHRDQQWVLRVDIQDFFPSINFGRVRGMFRAFPFEYPAEVATLLAQLCCHANQLPQGAPTSPIVSNYVCRAMDTRLAELAREERCHFSRYADDLTFSTDRTTFPPALAHIDGGMSIAGPAIVELIEGSGFELNAAKTKLMRRTQRQRVTGLVVNEKLNVSTHYVRRLRNLLYIWHSYGEADAITALARSEPARNWPPGKDQPSFRSVVQGRVNYVGSVKGWSDPGYLSLALKLARLDDGFQPKSLPPLPEGTVRVFCEGESDWPHIEAAQRYFHSRGDFIGLDLVGETLDKWGDRELLRRCEALAQSPQVACCIFLFDRDSQSVLKDAVDSGEWKDFGNGVAAVALAPPSWKAAEDRICIELLHDPTVLATEDSEERRVFLAEEFHSDSGQHRGGSFIVPYAQGKRDDAPLVCEKVYEIGTNRSAALAKTAFAKLVRDQARPFHQVSFEGFRPTFEIVERAARATASQLLRVPQRPRK